MGWGRLVDVHAIDAAGEVVPEPSFEDLVIREDVASDGVNYKLFQSRIGGAERLIVLRRADDPDFLSCVREAEGLVPVAVRGDGTATPGPFGFVPRNAALVCVFDDLLDDSSAAAEGLLDSVRVRCGEAPGSAFAARLFHDPNHGGLGPDGRFHSTRVVIDLTISGVDAMEPSPLPLNTTGLPEGDPASTGPNVSVRFATERDLRSGPHSRLQNLAGAPLSLTGNGPVDSGDPTRPLVRGMRSGNRLDPNRGFLQDHKPPRLLGEFAAAITGARPAPGDTSGRVFVVNFAFGSLCSVAAMSGDVLTYDGGFVEVLRPGLGPNLEGQVRGALVAAAGDEPVDARALLGPSRFVTLYRPSLPIDESCWVSFTPGGGVPARGLDPSLVAKVRFNEPIAAESLSGYGGLRLIEGGAELAERPRSLVPGELLQDADGTGLAFVPLLPLDHTQGLAEVHRVELTRALLDLAGNAPRALPGALEFSLEPSAPTRRTDGVVVELEDPLRGGRQEPVEPGGRTEVQEGAAVHTVWIDSRSPSPDYAGWLVECSELPGRPVAVAFRGADGFLGAGRAPFDGVGLDARGNLLRGRVLFRGGVSDWCEDLSALSGARYVQVRLCLDDPDGVSTFSLAFEP